MTNDFEVMPVGTKARIERLEAEVARLRAQQAEPVARQWRSLTIQEINDLPEVGGVWWDFGVRDAVLRAIHAVDAKLREKNT